MWQPITTMNSLLAPRRSRLVRQASRLLLLALLFLTGSARAQTGAGTALAFDGVNDYVSISNSAALNAYPLTVAA